MTTVITNHHWREFIVRWDVPKEVLASQFDWTSEAYEEHGDYSDGFICYRGHWYHVGEFMRGAPIEGFHGFAADSFSSGIAIKLSEDGEQYQIATVLA